MHVTGGARAASAGRRHYQRKPGNETECHLGCHGVHDTKQRYGVVQGR